MEPRSYLYVPADQKALLLKAHQRDADALVIDLEDAVLPGAKGFARDVLTEWLGRHATDKPIWVRINSDDLLADISLLASHVTGVILPKAEPRTLDSVDCMLSEVEGYLGLGDATLGVIALIETAKGLRASHDLACHRRTAHLALGRADIAAELRLTVNPDGPEFRTILLDLVIASSAAGIAPPIAPTSTDFRDLDALRESTERMFELGMYGRTAIHPAQTPVINQVFTPSKQEIEKARELIAAFDGAKRSGRGVAVDDDGRMIDVAIVRSAREVMRRANLIMPTA